MEKIKITNEKPKDLFETSLEKWTEDYLKDVGLALKDLEGKKILEVGAGQGKLAKFLKEKGINITSLERHPEFYDEQGGILKDIDFVVGDVLAIPFPDQSFDIIISRAAPPTVFFHTKGEIVEQLREAKRVLKEGGKFYFGPGYNSSIFSDEEIGEWFGKTREERNALPREVRINKFKEEYNKFLKNIDPNISVNKREKAKDDTSDQYYVLSKTKI